MAQERPETIAGVTDVDLSGQTVAVTGGTDGVGRETAVSLGRLGADVIVHGRSARKADRVVDTIESTGGSAERFLADFADESAVHELADYVLETAGEVDVLVNNAGTQYSKGQLTESGVERTMAVNHLAPFVLTNRLAPAIEAAGGRIVTVSSQVHQRSTFDMDALTTVQGYDAFEAYGHSKFANVLFTYALARRLESATANCLHPGFVPGSALWRDTNVILRSVMRAIGTLPSTIQNLVGKTPAAAAATPVFLAASPEVADVSGEYFVDMESMESAPRTYDEPLQERLWDRSRALVAMDEEDILA